MLKIKSIPLVLLIMALISCENKPKIVEMGDFKEYIDNTLNMGMKYPGNWNVIKEEGKSFYANSMKNGEERLITFASNGAPIAGFSMMAIKLDSNTTMEKVEQSLREFKASAYDADEILNIDGVKVKKMTYGFQLNDGFCKGFTIVGQKDSTMATVIKFKTFVDSYKEYEPKLKEIIASITLAQTPPERSDTLFISSSEFPFPSDTLTGKSGQGFTINIPKNFKASKSSAAGAEFSQKYDGERRGDSYVQVDVIDASKQSNLKKIVEQTTKAIPNKKESNLKISGLDAVLIEYSASAQIQRRLYYIVKNKKLYRVTVDWFKGEQKEYLPVFEKVVNSIKIQ